MHGIISTVLSHISGHFAVGYANAVTTAVHNHKNSRCPILRNAEGRSGLTPRCHNGGCRGFPAVDQKLAAAAEGNVHIV